MDLEKFLKQNMEEIREDDSRKEQSLAQFREWLSKHPFIVRCRQDDSWLLSFLRTKKYSMDDAYKSFENHFLYRYARPEWFHIDEGKIPLYREMGKDRPAYALRKRDPSNGSFVFVVNMGKFDFEKYGLGQAFNAVYNSLTALFENEENQILGCTIIFNYAEAPLKVLATFPLKDVADFAASTNKASGRFKRFIIVGLPTAAHTILNAAKMAMSEKMKGRILLVKDIEELGTQIDKSILTDYLGGPENEQEVFEDFIKLLESKLEAIKGTNDFEIDIEKAKACRNIEESVGSFRTLQID